MLSTYFRSPVFDGLFAVTALQLVGLLVLIILAFRLCQPWFASTSNKATCFGFRWALILSTLSSALLVITLGVAAAQSQINGTPVIGYAGIVAIVSTLCEGLAKSILSYALIRVALHPLREVGYVRRDVPLARAFVTLGALITLILVGIQSYTEYRALRPGFANTNDTTIDLDEGALYASLALAILNILWFIVVGATGLGCSIYALRKTRSVETHPQFRKAIKLMIAVASVWLAKALVVIIIAAVGAARASLDGLALGPVSGNLILYIFDLLETLVVYSLFVACFRTANDRLPL